MSSIAFAAVLQASLLGLVPMNEVSYSYEKARQETAQTGRPMMVLVGADWCPACVKMKNQVLPTIVKPGLLKKIAFAVVNLDKESKLGRKLTHNGPIPQLVMFRRVNQQWKARRLIGGQQPEKVKKFIEEGLTLDSKAKATEAKKDSATSEK